MKHILRLTGFLAITLLFSQCVDNEFDEPPTGGSDPDISADQIISLTEVMALYAPDEFNPIGLDKYLKAVVVADDESGNFFRQIIIEDESSDLGIALVIDEVELYNTYPVGRRVFVHLKDLFIGDNNGLPQIGATPAEVNGFTRITGIQSELAKNEVVLPGAFGIEVTPRVRKVSELTRNDLNTLIKFEMVQFSESSADRTFAILETNSAVNHILSDCDGNDIIVRTSGFADFADELTPAGNGDLIGVYSVFGRDEQIFIREPSDLAMENMRCEAPMLSILDLRTRFNGGSDEAPRGVIVGTVISDYTANNVNGRNLFFQDESAGILLRFTGNHDFSIGSRLMVDVSSLELSEFRDLLQVNNIPFENAEFLGMVGLPTPQEVTIGEINDNFEAYESEYVVIKNATISGGAVYSGGKTVSDGTGSIDMFTQSAATFAQAPVPTGEVEITAIVSQFNDPQLVLNSDQDVQGGMTGGGGGDPLTILSLRDKFNAGGSSADNGEITGVVISDRSNGNVNNRNIFIQDETAGIVVRFSAEHSFNLGEELTINVSGLELSEFRGLLQVNNVPLSNVNSNGSGNLPSPQEVTISAITSDVEAYESELVRIIDAGISGSSTYNGNTTITDATGSIPMFTLSGASFADAALPGENVNLTAIVSTFDDPQLLIRSLADVETDGGGGGGNDDFLTLMSIRNSFESGASSAANGKIKGVVISDYVNENTTGRNLHIQDASGGITLRFTANHDYILGTELEVDVSGLELSEFNGLLQINNIPAENATSLGAGSLPEPRVVTVKEVLDNLEDWESTLIKINDVMLSGSSTFSGSIMVTDATGSIASFTRSQASFANSTVPSGERDIMGIVTQFNDAQITIRNLSDISE